MAASKIQKVVPCMWYAKDVEEAVRFYTRVFPKSRVKRVSAMAAESPSGPPGSVKIVEFTLFGQEFLAFSAGPHDDFNDAISFMVNCDSQEEIDRYWDAILKNGGKPSACGWINDKYGVRWQIVPVQLAAWMAHRDAAKAKRVTAEMLSQVKFDIAKLEAAFKGR